MRTRWSAGLSVLALTLMTACSTTTPEQQAQEEAVRPYLNVLAAEVKAIPSVTCVLAVLPTGGVPGGAQSDIIAVDVQTELPLGDPRVDEVLNQVGKLFWRSPVPVFTLDITAFGGGVRLGPDGKASIEREDPLTVDGLTALYGPRAPVPATLPPIQDPGRPNC